MLNLTQGFVSMIIASQTYTVYGPIIRAYMLKWLMQGNRYCHYHALCLAGGNTGPTEFRMLDISQTLP